ncbi:hypothetical protein [Thioflexithrix psekupsensis]|uniref:Uncharacterized protein n=1 Tax=Thioflexithrix psekupsensis TaxID=1570016 RepID=A0A251XBG0_9GAMM|nr:hypothetical protein [Thioflexithrix psekupsensis]OUD15638.1 hypothetical protein TPSD3_03720 [Thioflexithrix psekupsensis]
MFILNLFPLIGVPILLYCLIGLGYLGVMDSTELFTLTLVSETQWVLNVADFLVILAIFLLYIEIFKATRTSAISIVDHILSLGVFIASLVTFLIWPPAGTSTFFMLTLIAMIDVIAGFTITISTARRDIGISS